MDLYLVGKIVPEEGPNSWELEGIFDTKDAALKTCTTANHFIGTIELNEVAPVERTNFRESYFPLHSQLEITS